MVLATNLLDILGELRDLGALRAVEWDRTEPKLVKFIYPTLITYTTPSKTSRGFKDSDKVTEDTEKLYKELGIVLSITLDS